MRSLQEFFPLVTPEDLAEDERQEAADRRKRELELQAVPVPVMDGDNSLLTRPSRRTSRSKTPLMNPLVKERLRHESGKIEISEETRRYKKVDLDSFIENLIELEDDDVIE